MVAVKQTSSNRDTNTKRLFPFEVHTFRYEGGPRSHYWSAIHYRRLDSQHL